MKSKLLLIAGCLLAAGCGEIVLEAPIESAPPANSVRILLVGDVMLGRSVAPVLVGNPDEVVAGVRHLLDGADFVDANLESPLTNRPHISDNDNTLEAGPEAAKHLAAAGFDLTPLPNNHSS